MNKYWEKSGKACSDSSDNKMNYVVLFKYYNYVSFIVHLMFWHIQQKYHIGNQTLFLVQKIIGLRPRSGLGLCPLEDQAVYLKQ